jgi:hypothetical protein
MEQRTENRIGLDQLRVTAGARVCPTEALWQGRKEERTLAGTMAETAWAPHFPVVCLVSTPQLPAAINTRSQPCEQPHSGQ